MRRSRLTEAVQGSSLGKARMVFSTGVEPKAGLKPIKALYSGTGIMKKDDRFFFEATRHLLLRRENMAWG